MKKIISGFTALIVILLGYFIASFLATIVMIFTPLASLLSKVGTAGLVISYSVFMCLVISIYYYLLSKSKWYKPILVQVNAVYTLLVCVIFTILFVIAKASLLSSAMSIASVFALPFFPALLFLSLMSGSYSAMLAIGITMIYSMCFSLLITKRIKLLSSSVICFACAGLCFFSYFNSPHYKYKDQGHGFTYFNGLSSVDLSDYTPYSDSGKLVTLDHEPALMIEKQKDMPVLDGAEACYPVYSAIAKAIYKDIDLIEKEYQDTYPYNNGSVVTFYNTAVGFERLISGEVDMFFGARPSKSQLELAKEYGVELEYTEIGREGFVFFVNEDNPIDALTRDQIKAIYHGDITNWKEVGGKNENIIAFQRPERSGSQSMMVYFMGDVSLKEPLTYEMEAAMMGIIEQVAEYENEAGAIGYSFRYFFEGLTQVEGAKMIAVDGVYPSTESIKTGEYPLVASLYCITLKGNDNENVQKVLDFLLSEDGQYIIEQTGYSPVK